MEVLGRVTEDGRDAGMRGPDVVGRETGHRETSVEYYAGSVRAERQRSAARRSAAARDGATRPLTRTSRSR